MTNFFPYFPMFSFSTMLFLNNNRHTSGCKWAPLHQQLPIIKGLNKTKVNATKMKSAIGRSFKLKPKIIQMLQVNFVCFQRL